MGPFSATKNGLDGDGVITLVLAAAIVLAFLVIKRPTNAAVTVFVFAALAAAVAIYDWVDISKQADDLAGSSTGVSAGVGFGLVMCAVGAVVVAVGGLMARSESKGVAGAP